jgi:transposase
MEDFMDTVYVGIDISKGYADIQTINDSGTTLPFRGSFDDTSEGHNLVKKHIQSLLQKTNKKGRILIGMESTGGLERNWLHLLKNLPYADKLSIYLLNPLVVHRFLERELHRNTTDPISALGIAQYLHRGLRSRDTTYSSDLYGAQKLCRFIKRLIKNSAQLQSELQLALVVCNPEMVKYCRETIPKWVLFLLKHYPTAPLLSKATQSQLAQIPYMKDKRIPSLIKAAKRSVASETDDEMACYLIVLIDELLELQKKIETIKTKLAMMFREDIAFQLLQSIKGIGEWTAIILRIEIGDITRFYSSNALVAYSGLDPCVKQSGDRTRTIGISKEGKSIIRAVLYTSALSAIKCNPAIKECYYRLRKRGKTHYQAITACMRKLLCICYACWISGQKYDPERSEKDREKYEIKRKEKKIKSQGQIRITQRLNAPISKREARKRRAAFMSQQEYHPGIRDPEAAQKEHMT